MIFTLNFYEFLHTVYKYVLNSVVKISMMFAKYFEYYAIILRGGAFFHGHAVDSKLVLKLQPFSSELKVNFHHSLILQELWMSMHQLTSFHF